MTDDERDKYAALARRIAEVVRDTPEIAEIVRELEREQTPRLISNTPPLTELLRQTRWGNRPELDDD